MDCGRMLMLGRDNWRDNQSASKKRIEFAIMGIAGNCTLGDPVPGDSPNMVVGDTGRVRDIRGHYFVPASEFQIFPLQTWSKVFGQRIYFLKIWCSSTSWDSIDNHITMFFPSQIVFSCFKSNQIKSNMMNDIDNFLTFVFLLML